MVVAFKNKSLCYIPCEHTNSAHHLAVSIQGFVPREEDHRHFRHSCTLLCLQLQLTNLPKRSDGFVADMDLD